MAIMEEQTYIKQQWQE